MIDVACAALVRRSEEVLKTLQWRLTFWQAIFSTFVAGNCKLRSVVVQICTQLLGNGCNWRVATSASAVIGSYCWKRGQNIMSRLQCMFQWCCCCMKHGGGIFGSSGLSDIYIGKAVLLVHRMHPSHSLFAPLFFLIFSKRKHFLEQCRQGREKCSVRDSSKHRASWCWSSRMEQMLSKWVEDQYQCKVSASIFLAYEKACRIWKNCSRRRKALLSFSSSSWLARFQHR